MFSLNIRKDGYVKASELNEFLDKFSDILVERFEEAEQRTKDVAAENKELRRRVEYLERLSRAPRARA